MKLDTAAILAKLTVITAVLRKHAPVLCFVVFGVLYGYILVTVSGLSGQEPSQPEIDKQLKAVARPKIDRNVAETMEGLKERNVNIQAIFDQARDNPFSE